VVVSSELEDSVFEEVFSEPEDDSVEDDAEESVSEDVVEEVEDDTVPGSGSGFPE